MGTMDTGTGPTSSEPVSLSAETPAEVSAADPVIEIAPAVLPESTAPESTAPVKKPRRKSKRRRSGRRLPSGAE